MFDFNRDTEIILGKPNFVCGSIARDLRACGKDIPEKAVAEQAHVIYWLLEMYERHGEKWVEAAIQWVKDNKTVELDGAQPCVCPKFDDGSKIFPQRTCDGCSSPRNSL